MAKRTQGIADLPGHGIQILGPGVFVGIFGIELRHAVGRHQVDVGVRYVKTRNHQADSAAFGKPIEGGGDLVRHGKEMGGRLGGQVMPAVGFLARYDQQMPPGYRLDVHEGHAFAVAPDEAAGDLAVDDSGKDAAHVVLLFGLSIVLGTFCFFLFDNPLFRLVDHVIVIDQREARRLVCAYCASHLG